MGFLASFLTEVTSLRQFVGVLGQYIQNEWDVAGDKTRASDYARHDQ